MWVYYTKIRVAQVFSGYVPAILRFEPLPPPCAIVGIVSNTPVGSLGTDTLVLLCNPAPSSYCYTLQQ